MNLANTADSDLNCSFLSLESTTQFSNKIDVKNKLKDKIVSVFVLFY